MTRDYLAPDNDNDIESIFSGWQGPFEQKKERAIEILKEIRSFMFPRLNKAYNKIIGHHPGWANKENESATDSDFTAGQSWTGMKNAFNVFSRTGSKSVLSGVLAATLAASPAGVALAKDVGVGMASKVKINTMSSIAKRSSSWRDVVDTVTKLTDPKDELIRSRAADLIYRTGVHESGYLKNVRQIGGGPARGLTQVEKNTALDIVQNYAKSRKDVMNVLTTVSGKSQTQLMGMSKEGIGSLIEENQAFAAALTRYKYKISPEAIPVSLEDQAAYWAKNYWAGNNNLRKEKIRQFISNNRKFEKDVITDLKIPASIRNKMNANTMGLTNNVLHNRKVNHSIINPIEKVKHLFR